MNKKNMFGLLVLVSVMFGLSAVAQEKVASKADLAKVAQNPIGNLISVPFQYNANFGTGPNNDVQSILNIQPVLPVGVGDDWNLINRFIVPVIDQPKPVDETGMGDIQYQGFFTPSRPKGLIWGIGPVLSFPTATEDLLGSEQWSAGPGIVLLKMAGPWVFGCVADNIWSFSGDNDRSNVNAFFFQYFVNYNFEDFYLTSVPAITANWKADSSDRWTVPFGAGIGKIFKIGRLPINCQLHAYYNVEHPDNAANWQARLQIQLMFPKKSNI